jgi:hypothetical protein
MALFKYKEMMYDIMCHKSIFNENIIPTIYLPELDQTYPIDTDTFLRLLNETEEDDFEVTFDTCFYEKYTGRIIRKKDIPSNMPTMNLQKKFLCLLKPKHKRALDICTEVSLKYTINENNKKGE